MAEGVIDALEIVQIDIHERQQASRLRIGERCAQMAVRLVAIRQPCQRIAIGEPHDVRHHTIELARQDRDFIRPLEIEPDCRIRALTDRDRMASDSSEWIQDRAIQENDQQYDDHHGGNHEVRERVVHRCIAPLCDLPRYVDSQRQDGMTVNVIIGVVDLYETLRFDLPIRTTRVGRRQHRNVRLCLSTNRRDLLRRYHPAHDHHAARRPMRKAVQHRPGGQQQDSTIGLQKAMSRSPSV